MEDSKPPARGQLPPELRSPPLHGPCPTDLRTLWSAHHFGENKGVAHEV